MSYPLPRCGAPLGNDFSRADYLWTFVWPPAAIVFVSIVSAVAGLLALCPRSVVATVVLALAIGACVVYGATLPLAPMSDAWPQQWVVISVVWGAGVVHLPGLIALLAGRAHRGGILGPEVS